MKFFFYQNILSLHQSAFIRELSLTNEVYLFVEEKLSVERRHQGWSIPDFGNTNIIVNPTKKELLNAVQMPNSIHIVSTFEAYDISKSIFSLSRKYNFKLGVMTESFNFFGIRGFIRKLYYKFMRIKWNRRVDFILAIGSLARDCFSEAGFDNNKIFDWAYFTENKLQNEVKKRYEISSKPRLIFVGSIDRSKNILRILDLVVENILDNIEEFIIIGKGPLESRLQYYTERYHKIKFLRTLKNTDVINHIGKSDILILPSLYDGWGAVINESLTVGTPVICSDRCGGKILIGNKSGRVFSIKNDDFIEQYNDLKNNMVDLSREAIKEFVSQNLSGFAGSNYLIKIIDSVYNGSIRPIAPWIKNKL